MGPVFRSGGLATPHAIVASFSGEPRVQDDAHGHLKGSMFLSTFAFIEDRFGPQARERVLRHLTAAERDVLSGLVLPITWYPLPLFGRLLRAMDAEVGRGDFALVAERGEWTATRDLKTLRRAVLKLVTIPWIITKGAGLWHQFHDTGRWEVRQSDPASAVAELHDLGYVDEAICASVRGWIIGLSKLSGARKVDVRHTTCRAHGDVACVFEVRWS
jgi:predicted hydrocarbon binding protein